MGKEVLVEYVFFWSLLRSLGTPGTQKFDQGSNVTQKDEAEKAKKLTTLLVFWALI